MSNAGLERRHTLPNGAPVVLPLMALRVLSEQQHVVSRGKANTRTQNPYRHTPPAVLILTLSRPLPRGPHRAMHHRRCKCRPLLSRSGVTHQRPRPHPYHEALLQVVDSGWATPWRLACGAIEAWATRVAGKSSPARGGCRLGHQRASLQGACGSPAAHTRPPWHPTGCE